MILGHLLITILAGISISQARLDRAKETIVLDAVTAIELGDYKKADALLSSAARRWPLDDAVLFYLAKCKLALGDGGIICLMQQRVQRLLGLFNAVHNRYLYLNILSFP